MDKSTFTKQEVVELLDYVAANLTINKDKKGSFRNFPWRSGKSDYMKSEYIVDVVLMAKEAKRMQLDFLTGEIDKGIEEYLRNKTNK